jgi:MoxR-like ATPase
MVPWQSDVAQVQRSLEEHGYLADEGLATAVFLCLRLGRPLLLEGEAGVGKTELAKTLAAMTGSELIRIQCHEGLDVSQAVYEWDHPRQLLHLRAAEASGDATRRGTDALEGELYDERFLIRRPLLRAISTPPGDRPPLLLIDELDRADDEFEAFLLELLGEWSITIPELGTVHAEVPPIVVITSNRTRDLHDALRRRCLHHWVEHPDPAREVDIVRLRVPEAAESLSRQVTSAVEALRGAGLYKAPGVAETIDWTRALVALGCGTLDETSARATLGTVLKHREDQERVLAGGLADLVDSEPRAS